jgi:hypothetical protein
MGFLQRKRRDGVSPSRGPSHLPKHEHTERSERKASAIQFVKMWIKISWLDILFMVILGVSAQLVRNPQLANMLDLMVNNG